ncbi:MAG: FkbM family methyltransferase [Parasphingorhabdus sp.]|jgi:FkbM family methyltransferase
MPSYRQRLTALCSRRHPFYSGCAQLANSRLIKLLSGTKPCNVWCRVPGGQVLADLDDYVGRAAFFVGDLDRKITWICKKIVREGDTVLDIGANIGVVTVPLAKFVGKSRNVHSFEPNPSLAQQLNNTIAHNKLTNVHLHPVALGSRRDTLELVIPEGNRGAASLVRQTIVKTAETVRVQVEMLDGLCEKEQIKSVRLIKIDVEGFETEVFKGAHELLSKIKPDAILFELNERSSQELSEEPLMKLLHSYGYDFFSIPKNLLRMQLLPLNSRSKREVTGHDFLAVPKGEKFNEIARLVNAKK